MGNKKYLLYVHNEKFALESHKSSLVNLLLDWYYTMYPPGTLLEGVRLESEMISRERTESTPEAVLVESRIIKEPGDIKLKPRGKQCKNGHSIPEGRDRCMGKGCKYAN